MTFNYQAIRNQSFLLFGTDILAIILIDIFPPSEEPAIIATR